MGVKNAASALLRNRPAIARHVLPILDLSAARGNDSDAKRELARRIDQAFSNSGFCYVVNHGVANSVIDDAFAVAKKFFHLPLEEKLTLTPSTETMFRGYLAETRKYRTFYEFDPNGPIAETKAQSVGGKENFVFGAESPRRNPGFTATGWRSGPNPWPENFSEFRSRSYLFFEEMRKVGDDILRMIALTCGTNENFFKEKYGEAQDTSVGVLAYYPALTPSDVAAGRLNLPGHADYSCLSLLVQDEVGGLQVQDRTSLAWIDATPIPDTIVVNVGDLLARWSNNRYVSSLHRVMNTAGRERYSFIVGHNPRADATVDPRDLGASDNESLYPPVQVGEHMWARMMETGATDEDIAIAKRTSG